MSVSSEGRYSAGLDAHMRESDSVGVHAVTYDDNSVGVFGMSEGADSTGVEAYSTGVRSDAVSALARGSGGRGVYGESSYSTRYLWKGEGGRVFHDQPGGRRGEPLPGRERLDRVRLQPGDRVRTTGSDSPGVTAVTGAMNSDGFQATTSAYNSDGIQVRHMGR